MLRRLGERLTDDPHRQLRAVALACEHPRQAAGLDDSVKAGHRAQPASHEITRLVLLQDRVEGLEGVAGRVRIDPLGAQSLGQGATGQAFG